MRVLVAVDLSGHGHNFESVPVAPAMRPGTMDEYPQATFVAQLFATCLRRSRNLAEQRCVLDTASARYTSASSPVLRQRPALDRSI
jgi:hypothetical protein